MKELNMENANDHPFKVSIVKDAEFFANSHPYKVSIEGGGGGGNEGRVVDELPEEGEPGYIYLVLKEHTPEGDIYDEYMWVLLQDGETHGWEHIGATNEIKTGGPTILTTADYNWNSVNRSTSGTLDSFALWLLDDGMYAFEGGTPLSKVKTDKNGSIPGGESISTKQAPTILVLSSVDVWNRPIKTFIGSASMGGNPPGVNAFFAIGTGTDGTARYNNGSGMGQYGLTRGDIVDDLTSYDSSLPLSAAQGRVLKNMIDNISAVRLLTTADLNWNTATQSATEPYNSIALWLLEPGMYYRKPNNRITTLLSRTRSLADTGGTFIVMPRGMNGTENELVTVLYGEELNPNLKTLTIQISDGSEYFSSEKVITTRDVANNLTTTYSGYALDARQGKVLDDKIGQIETVLQTLTIGNGV